MMADTERARAALQSIPPDCDRDTWVRAGMAAHAAGLDFEDFDSWSAQAGNYDARAARDTWRSFKAGKGVGAGTLHRMAGEHGHQHQSPSKPPKRAAAPPPAPRPGMAPADVWARCESATWEHAYIVRKAAQGVPLDTLRVVPAGDALRIGGNAMAGALAVPAYAADGALQSLQLIPPQGKKMNLPGAAMAGASFTVGAIKRRKQIWGALHPDNQRFDSVWDALEPGGKTLSTRNDDGTFVKGEPKEKAFAASTAAAAGMTKQAINQHLARADAMGDEGLKNEPLYIVEGIGQAWACWQATGRAAVVCFGWGNVGTVARELHQKGHALVLVPDVGKEPQAETLARELGCSVAAMPQGEADNFDCNDLAQRDGADVLAALLESAQSFKPEPLLTPVDVAGVLTRPSPPPRFVWDGYCPRGVVTLLGAHGGTGKSTIALMLAVAVATGRELFGIATDAAPVVFASFEDGAHIVRHRLAHICQCWGINPAELAGLHIVDGTANPELFASDGRGPGDVTPAYAELLALVKQAGAGLVIVDNASDAYGGDEIQRRQVRAFMRALAVIAREADAAVLLLAHVDKGTSRRERSDTEGYSGSTAWHNSARSRIFMSRDDGVLTLAHQKSNLAKLREPLALEWPEGGLPQAVQALSPVVQGISDRVDTKALLRLIAEFSERGEHVTTATTSRTHAAKLLAGEGTYPKGRKPADVFNLLRKAERAGHIERVFVATENRKQKEVWAVTSEGRELAELPPVAPTAPTAPTSCFEEVSAPEEVGAPTAPTSAGGTGEERSAEVGAHAGAETPEGTSDCADFTDEGAADAD